MRKPVSILNDPVGMGLTLAMSAIAALSTRPQATTPRRAYGSDYFSQGRGRSHHSPYQCCRPKADHRSNRRKAAHRAKQRRLKA